jgi:polyribonucleotide nucleotidyltransferase
MKNISLSTEINGKTLTLETGRFAEQANAAVLSRLGDTIVLATVVSSALREELDYFPLTVEYIERLYAGGRIKGSRWVKREGRPSDEAILTARLIDRSIRPLFPQGYKNEVQVIVTVLSVDFENDPSIPAMIATSAALTISDIPFNGPVGSLRIGYKDGTFFANPVTGDLEFSDANIIASYTKDAIVMVEGDLNEIGPKETIKAIEFGKNQSQKIISLIEKLNQKVGQKKQSYEIPKTNQTLKRQILKKAKEKIDEIFKKISLGQKMSDELIFLKQTLFEEHEEESKKTTSNLIDEIFKDTLRQQILIKNKRADNRKPDEIRPLEIKIGLLPRTHGSASFTRGQTQTLTVVTLGSPSLEQLIESAVGEESKRYIHHYNMPPFSVGETGRLGWPSRREVGHGALAERALFKVIPSEEVFPYTIRVVSEILSSNGSSSMAAVCGSTLALMDAGVPIKNPVAGIAMGLVSDSKKKVLLTDITGFEDYCGDMDFKIAGTQKGLTAMQLDVKTDILTLNDLEEALVKAQKSINYLICEILKVIPKHRAQVSKYAPKIAVLHVEPEKIGEIIGPGGKTIRKIIAETGAAIDVEDDGSVNISAPDKEAVTRAIAWIDGLTRQPQIGEIYEGVVKRILPFGAFVEILPGKEGLVHVSRMSTKFVKDPNQIVKIGDKVKVKIFEIDDMGRINLSMLLTPIPHQSQYSPPPKRFKKRF